MALIQNRDGTLSTPEAYKESLNWEGGDHKNEKIEIMKMRVALRPIERRAFDAFMASDAVKRYVNNKQIAEDKREGRKTLLENSAVQELMRVRTEDRRLQDSKKPPLKDADYRLSLTSEGIVISKYREKQLRESELQQEKDRTAAALEAMGGRAPDTHSW